MPTTLKTLTYTTFTLAALTTGIFFTTHPVSAQTCHQIYLPQQTPQGYASPASWFSGDLMIKGDCSNQSVSVTVGNNSPTTYIYETSYRWTGSQWQTVTLQGSDKTGPWIKQTATQSFTSNQTPTYYVAYTCELVNNSWKCGCLTQSCTQSGWQLQVFSQPSGGSSGGGGSSNDDRGGGLPYDGEVPEVVQELCPGAVLIEESETMFWEDRTKSFSKSGGPNPSNRVSIKESGGIRYLQLDVRKGEEQTIWTNQQLRWADAPLKCMVLEYDSYFSPNYDGKATQPDQTGQKGIASIKGGLTDLIYGSCGYIDTNDFKDYTKPGLNKCYTASTDWSSSLRPLIYSYPANRGILGGERLFQASTQRLFGKTFTTGTTGNNVTATPGKWQRVAIGVRLNDDRKDNGRGVFFLDGVKVIDTGNNVVWAYEPSKGRGIKVLYLRHGYGGNSEKLIPTKDMFERSRNLRVWGIRQ